MAKRGEYDEDGIVKRKYVNDLFKEIFRKSIHLCTVFVPYLLHRFGNIVLVILTVILCVYIIAEFARFKGVTIPLISKVTEAAARKRDQNRFVLGPVTLALGVIITALFFNPMAATAGIYALALGDGLASLAGKFYGSIQIPFTRGKTIAGSLTCFFAIYFSLFFLFNNVSIAFFLALAGMFIELLPLKDFDNLLIPLLIASITQFYFHI